MCQVSLGLHILLELHIDCLKKGSISCTYQKIIDKLKFVLTVPSFSKGFKFWLDKNFQEAILKIG